MHADSDWEGYYALTCCIALVTGTSRIHEWGWRLSVGLAAVPAIVLIIGSLLLPETPNSLFERGHHEKVPPPNLPGCQAACCTAIACV